MTAQRPLARAAHFLGVQPRPAPGRLLHAFVGALFGLTLTALVLRLSLGAGSALPLLIAPMGASSVLLFAVPASPLAQPWAIFGGNTVSAIVGIAVAKALGDLALAPAVAVALAITAMSLARCLHPPGGAVALVTVLGGPAIARAGWSFALFPVLVDSLLLVGFGWLYNAATRGNYPHHATLQVAPLAPRAGYSIADLEDVLRHYDELLDVSSEDLDVLFRQVEARAYERLHGVIRCDQIMQAGVPVLSPSDPLEAARTLLADDTLSAVPVVGDDGRLEGLLGVERLQRPDLAGRATLSAGTAMDPSPCLAAPGAPIDELLPILAGGRYRQACVVDSDGRLLGLITQTDLLAALWRGHVAENIAGNIPAESR